ncbi:MAG: hypothetical protein Q4F27_05375 [Desulfovibrionaceae bacterium]|nr:hypothetical protein [Desulfovibrionaceae bacterium]
MNSLYILFRWMLAGWLAIVLLMGVVVAHNVESLTQKNLPAYLFEHDSTPLPNLPPPPAPAPAPKVEKPAPPAPAAPEWTPLSHGQGALGKPEVQVLANGSVEVLLPCSGSPGEYRIYHPHNIPSLCVDLQGEWGRGISLDQRFAEGCLTRLQIAHHTKWLRVSGVARGGKRDALAPKVEHSSQKGLIRIIFHSGE